MYSIHMEKGGLDVDISDKHIISFIKEQGHPHTTEQIASKLNIPPGDLSKTLRRLQRMGYLSVETISPGCGMVIPRSRLLLMSDDEMEEVCDSLSSLKCLE